MTELSAWTTRHGARIYRIPLEAFPGFQVYATLFLYEDWRVLFDAGSGLESSNQSLLDGLQAVAADLGCPFGLKDLTHVIITHGHIDHFGGMPFLRANSPVPIGIHLADWQTVARHRARLDLMSARLDAFLLQAGLEAEKRQELLHTYRFTKRFYQDTLPDFVFNDEYNTWGPFEVVHLPGHCPGQVAVRFDEVVFIGDHVLNHIVPHQSPETLTPGTGIGNYLHSLTLLEAWLPEDVRLFPAHGDVIVNWRARLNAIRERLTLRLQQVLDLLAQPLTTLELCHRLYGADLQGYDTLLALEKTGAYLEYLYQRGLVTLDASEARAPFRYHRTENVHSVQILPKEKRQDVFLFAH